jgi:hypothetical protein
MKKSVGDGAKALMNFLMCDPAIYNKILTAGETGKTYVCVKVKDDGIVILGETNHWFWNQLIGCQFKLTFEKWALTVWDALIDLSAGGNAVALEEGLSAEIAQKAQRSEDYEWVVKRLYDCYEHVCNNKSGSDSAGSRGDKGSRMTREVIVNGEPIQLNINANGIKRTLSFPDATGRAFLNFDLGVVGVHVSKD